MSACSSPCPDAMLVKIILQEVLALQKTCFKGARNEHLKLIFFVCLFDVNDLNLLNGKILILLLAQIKL